MKTEEEVMEIEDVLEMGEIDMWVNETNITDSMAQLIYLIVAITLLSPTIMKYDNDINILCSEALQVRCDIII